MLSSAIKSLECINYVLVAIVILSLIKNKKNELFFVEISFFFSFAWRLFIGTQSSRYSLILVFYSILISVWFFKNSNKRFLVIFVFLFLIIFQTIDTFASYRDNYIFLLKDNLSYLNKNNPKSAFIVDSKEYDRLKDLKIQYYFEYDDRKTNEENQRDYLFWGFKFFFVSKCDTIFLPSKNDKTCTIGHFLTNKKRMRSIDVLELEANQLKEATGALPPTEKNLIRNGNFEKRLSKRTEIITEWSALENQDEYWRDAILPEHEYLFQSHKILKKMVHPFASLTDQNPIEGKNSLSVKYKGASILYLMNIVKADEAILSFLIKSIESDCVIEIVRWDFKKDDRWINTPCNCKILIPNNKLYRISIPFRKSDFKGSETLFGLKSSNSNIRIDCIEYSLLK